MTVTVRYFLFAACFVRFTALPICLAMLSAHGWIENRDIGDAAILDEQFLWMGFGRENTLARPYGAGGCGRPGTQETYTMPRGDMVESAPLP
ncbi:hypothetical protein NKJ46_05645 [Mesorhizobium sp. M0166]|uniref:hypothetical protein n=1 Tax=unclassified Mesorhizobium TaxID=325217 RepID=UPI0033380DA6